MPNKLTQHLIQSLATLQEQGEQERKCRTDMVRTMASKGYSLETLANVLYIDVNEVARLKNGKDKI
jgi:hypothetical protein